MTDTIRNLLISLSAHMAYMQGQLEARHELDDPEDFYWYRESVLLRQKVTDALAHEPAVPEGGEPTRDELWDLWLRLNNEMPDRPAAVAEFWEHACVHARARWGNPAPAPPADGEVAELVDWLEETGHLEMQADAQEGLRYFRTAELLQQQALVPAPPADGEVAELEALLRAVAADLDFDDRGDDAGRCYRAAELLQRQALVPVAVSDALIKAECALSDIAEGEPMADEGDPLQWAERRCADTLAIIRPTMRQHKIRTSEWPPVSAHALPIPQQQETDNG